MNCQLVYKIKGPSLDKILLPDVSKEIFNDNKKNKNQYLKASDVLTPEFLNSNWKGYNWKRFIVFHKSNNGGIHVDGNGNEWGINWIVNGSGVLNYWNFDQVEVDRYINNHYVYKTNRSPFLQYNTDIDNSPYLVNAMFPHQAVCQDRFAVSLRLGDQNDRVWNDTWEDVVEKFKDIINE